MMHLATLVSTVIQPQTFVIPATCDDESAVVVGTAGVQLLALSPVLRVFEVGSLLALRLAIPWIGRHWEHVPQYDHHGE
uniref:Uncharacterized protein n=1 Tax=Anopheles quadriannulatus TaxID=34691 RepID=A0A182XT80_ANOQN